MANVVKHNGISFACFQYQGVGAFIVCYAGYFRNFLYTNGYALNNIAICSFYSSGNSIRLRTDRGNKTNKKRKDMLFKCFQKITKITNIKRYYY